MLKISFSEKLSHDHHSIPGIYRDTPKLQKLSEGSGFKSRCTFMVTIRSLTESEAATECQRRATRSKSLSKMMRTSLDDPIDSD